MVLFLADVQTLINHQMSTNEGFQLYLFACIAANLPLGREVKKWTNKLKKFN